VNFAECLHDGTRLKADPGHRTGSKPLIMNCPACGKQYTLSDTGIVEITPGEGPELR
jgi:hypothetical protein